MSLHICSLYGSEWRQYQVRSKRYSHKKPNSVIAAPQPDRRECSETKLRGLGQPENFFFFSFFFDVAVLQAGERQCERNISQPKC